MQAQRLTELRGFLKDHIRQTVDFSQTAQNRGVPPPPVAKPCQPGAPRIDLVPRRRWELPRVDVATAIGRRESHRRFLAQPLTLMELSFLLWATQGVRAHLGGRTVMRTVPSAGNRHALETYVCVFNVDDLEPGCYRYLPVEHQLVLEFQRPDLAPRLVAASLGQSFVGAGAATFVWIAVSYRMEWRYGEAAHKVIALDAGHVCQNLYLACETVNAGTCAIAAYDQDRLDALLRLDGEDEFAIYLAPVGKVRHG